MELRCESASVVSLMWGMMVVLHVVDGGVMGTGVERGREVVYVERMGSDEVDEEMGDGIWWDGGRGWWGGGRCAIVEGVIMSDFL